MTDPDCIFCRIVRGRIPSRTVYSDDSVMAFLDTGPLADGHLLVIPREHYVTLCEMPSSLAAEMARVFPKLGQALLKVTGAEAFNVLINNGAVAGQVVPHLHAHLIPRVADDGLGYRWNPGTYREGRAAELADALVKALGEV